MGEAKRKRDGLTPVQRVALEASHKLMDEGMIVRAGFVGFMAAVFPDGCPDHQRQELENAFMAGSLHLWMSIMATLDPGAEPTDRDLRRMDLIQKELDDFGKVLEDRAAMQARTEGSA
jgi:hypothetical protein